MRVRCPLHANGCAWTGDYSEVQDHLTNSSEHLGSGGGGSNAGRAASRGPGPVDHSSLPSGAGANAAALKDQGNAKFALKQYSDAISLYSKAISVGLQAVTRRPVVVATTPAPMDDDDNNSGGREEEEEDDDEAMLRRAESRHGGSSGSGGPRRRMDESQSESESESDGDEEGTVRSGSEGLKGGVKGGRVGRFGQPMEEEASSSSAFLSSASTSAAAGSVVEGAGGAYVPDANTLVVATCYNNRGACHFMLRHFRAAAEDCAKAVELDPTYIKAHVRRAKSLVELGDFSTAALHLAEAHQLQPSLDLLAEHQKTYGRTGAQ